MSEQPCPVGSAHRISVFQYCLCTPVDLWFVVGSRLGRASSGRRCCLQSLPIVRWRFLAVPIALAMASFFLAPRPLVIAWQEPRDETNEAIPVEAWSQLGQPLRRITLAPIHQAELERALADAQQAMEADPDSAESAIWYGRRLAYLGRYRDAVDVFSAGMQRFPEDARFYRHRGHRWITLRRFDDAIQDLTLATRLIDGRDDEIEPDGMPNPAGVPTSTLHTNIWYHLGLAHYLKRHDAEALAAFENCLTACTNDDMRVATLDWLYMTLRRLGRHEQARAAVAKVADDAIILENHAYLRRIRLYQGKLSVDDLLSVSSPREEQENAAIDETIPAPTDVDLATYGYGVANWHLMEGDEVRALELFHRVVAGPQWAAFGYIAAEAQLAHRAVRR